MDTDDEKTQMALRHALAEYADAGWLRRRGHLGRVHVAALGVPYDRAKYRELRTLSGGEQKRLVLEFLLRGPDEVLLLDEPDNFLDVPGKIWLEERIRESDKTILFISHDRELLEQHRDPGGHRRARQRRQPGVDAPGRLRVVPPGAQGPVRALRGAAPPLGRGARQAQARWC